MFTLILVYITLGQYTLYCLIFVVVWSGSVFLFHSKSPTKAKPQRGDIEFISLKSPSVKSPAVVPNLTPEIIETDFFGSIPEIGKSNVSTPTVDSIDTSNEAFQTLLANQIEPPVELISEEFETIAELDFKDSQWPFTELDEKERSENFINDTFNDNESQDLLTDEINHNALLEELLSTHELVCEMQKDLGCDYMTAIANLPESTQAIYERVGFQPYISDN